jgi:hypothetical protein
MTKKHTLMQWKIVENDDEESSFEVLDNSSMFPHHGTPVTTSSQPCTNRLPTSSNTTTPTQHLQYPNGHVEGLRRINSPRCPIFARAAAPVVAPPASRMNRLVSGDPIIVVSGVHKGKRGTFIRKTAARICAQIDGLDTERFLAPKNIQRDTNARRAM